MVVSHFSRLVFILDSDIYPGQRESYPHPHTNAHRYSAPDPRSPAQGFPPNSGTNHALSQHDEAMYRRGSTGGFHPPHHHHNHAHHQPYPSPDYSTSSYYSGGQQQPQQSSPNDFGGSGPYANDYAPQQPSPGLQGPSQSSYTMDPYSPSAGSGTGTGTGSGGGYYQQELGHFAQQQARPPTTQTYYSPAHPSNYTQ